MGNILKKSVGDAGYSDSYFPTVKRIAHKLVAVVSEDRSRLRSLDDEHPGWRASCRSERVMARVQVSKIVGSAQRPNDFFEDLCDAKTGVTEREKERWGRLLKAIKEGKRPDEVGGPAQRIHLLKVGGDYWVGDDGNRRVALSKRMNLEDILCEVSVQETGRM